MPITSIPANDRRERFVASGGQTVFPFDFPIYAAGDLAVRRLRAGVETALSLGTDYTLTGANEQDGGTVTLTSGALAGDVLTLASAQAAGRQAVFTNGGSLPASSLEAEFNRMQIAMQQLRDQLARAIRLAETDPSTPVLPVASARANRILAFDAEGSPIATSAAVGSTVVTPYGQTLLDDMDAAAARGTLGVEVTNPGELRAYAGATTPARWLLCFGQAISRTTYASLFAAIGTAWGAGDGSTTFNVPDLRGRSLFGRDDMGGSAASRLTNGVSGVNGAALGATGGSQAMHQHTHGVTDPGHVHSGSVTGATAGASGGAVVIILGGANTASNTTGISINNAGSGTSQNIPPAAVVNWIIYAGV